MYTKAPLPEGFRRRFRNTFKGTIIAAGGFTCDIAEQALEDDELDLVAFGVPYIANPDLVERMQNGWPLAKVTAPPTTASVVPRKKAIPITRSGRRNKSHTVAVL